MTNSEVKASSSSNTPLSEPFSLADQILSQLHKTVIMKTGVMYLSGEYSTWIINHTNFGYSCRGKVYFVAQATDDENVFRSIGNSCSGCRQTLATPAISMTREEIAEKIKRDEKAKNWEYQRVAEGYAKDINPSGK